MTKLEVKENLLTANGRGTSLADLNPESKGYTSNTEVKRRLLNINSRVRLGGFAGGSYREELIMPYYSKN
jgi:hypothetical protein